DETNPAHRSWDMFPHYRAHEVAQKLTEIFRAKLSIKSAAPSTESSYLMSLRVPPLASGGTKQSRTLSAWHGITSSLPPFAKGGAPRNDTLLVDMRAEIKDGNFSIFSRALQKSISETLAQKKQIILFINRRGAANFVLCRDCGYVAKCQNCDAPLAYHLISQKPAMFCHRCNYKENPPGLCPQCQSHRIKAVGVGTQKVELEAKKLFSDALISRLDIDTAPNAKDQQKIIETFAKKETDILIATQIIFSWTAEISSAAPALAAIISADALLHLPDFRSGERTFQTITLLKNLLRPNGQFIIQTYNPESSVIKYAAQSDWQSFYQEEIETRQTLGYPPFSQIVKLTFRHKEPKKAGQETKILAAKLKQTNKDKNIQISDALPAFVPKEKGKFVWNIIIKFKLSQDVIPSPAPETFGFGCGINSARDLSTCLRKKMSKEFLRSRNSLLQYVPSNWEIDVDPSNLL
ncbi:primosomal protein N', partial [Patescibacteria group bacterium]|nr:primosomal protein N' [Patescibacteria group bacterium]